MSEQHTFKRFDADLRELAERVTVMGLAVSDEFQNAVQALREGSAALAKRVISGDERIDELQEEINALVLRVLTRQQPMAQDLRCILAAEQIADEFERVGDHSKNIAKRSLAIGHAPTATALSHVAWLHARVHHMLAGALHAYTDRDTALALEVWSNDAELDRIYKDFFKYLVAEMERDTQCVADCTQLLFVAKSLERIGDHATNIAEHANFMVTGTALPRRPRAETVVPAAG